MGEKNDFYQQMARKSADFLPFLLENLVEMVAEKT